MAEVIHFIKIILIAILRIIEKKRTGIYTVFHEAVSLCCC